MKKIEIRIPDGKRAEWVNGVLTLVDEKPKDVTERIKTFEDACKELNKMNSLIPVHPFIRSYGAYKSVRYDIVWRDTDILAYLKLRIICAALNEGWQPEFTEDERRYYPWFSLYTKTELENMPENEKKERVTIDTDGYDTEYAAFTFAGSGCTPSNADTDFGSCLCLKSKELAGYCGEQFISLWADYLLRRKGE